jgi:AsmA protein
MKQILKILLGLLGLLVLLMVLAAVLLPFVFDKEDLKSAIAGEVYEQTGRELDINGQLDFSVFPWLAVEVSDLGLSNAPGFGDRSFARIRAARVGVALVPLFSKQISIDEITLDGLELALEVNEQGKNNWDDLASGQADPAAEEKSPGMFSGKRVAGLDIRDANIEFHDRNAGAHYRLTGFTMQTGALGSGDPVPIEFRTGFEDVASGARADAELAAVAAIDLEAERFTFDDLELSLDMETEDSGQSVLIRSPRLGLDLDQQTLGLDAFTAEMAGLKLDGGLTASNILEDPVFSGSLNTAEFSPAESMQSMGMAVPETNDPDVLKRVKISTKFSGSTENLTLTGLAIELDQSSLNGELSVRDFDRPKVDFTLQVDNIDLDRYMQPATGETGTEDVAMPREELQGQEVEGRINAGTLRMGGLEFSDAEVGVVLRGGVLRLKPLTAGFYGGRYSGDITLDGSGSVPAVSLDEKIDSITFQRLVADIVDSESLSGTAQGHARLSGRGDTGSQVLGSLQGDLGLTLTEGALEGINIWYEIRRGMALYKGLAPPDPEPNRTVFSRMQLAADVDDGVVATRQLIGELPFLTVRGDGTVDLGRSLVDMDLVAEVRNAPELAEDPLAADLGGKSLPFRISGPLDDPSLKIDVEALLKSEATELLLDKLGGLGQKKDEQDEGGAGQGEQAQQDQLEEAAKNIFSGLLGGKDKDKDKDKDDDG